MNSMKTKDKPDKSEEKKEEIKPVEVPEVTEVPEVCDLCQDENDKNQVLTKAKIKVFFSRGWETEIVFACKECMEEEGLIEFKEDKEEAK